MKRREFLKFLGLAPVAAAVPAMALPRPEKPTGIDYGALSADIQKMWDESIDHVTGPQSAMVERIDRLAADVSTANIGHVTAGTLRSADGSIVCDLGQKEIRFTLDA